MNTELGAEQRQEGRPLWPRLAALALLLLLFALLTVGAHQNALTADEPAYIAGGYAWWQQRQAATHQLLPQRGYPPLLAALEALPLHLAAPDIPLEQLAGWPDDFDTFTLAFKPFLEPLQRSELAARFVTICLTVLLGAVVFRWASDLSTPRGRGSEGRRAGLIALTVLVFDPTLLAHGRLAHSDAGAVALGTTALFVAWRWSQRPTWPRALALGVLLALTLLAKVSGPLWLAAAGLLLATTVLVRRSEGHAGRLTGQAAVALAVAGLLWWAAYDFTWGRVDGLPLPLPAPAYWQSIAYLRGYTTDIFALGLRQAGPGWWWYFPLAFLLKNPLPLLLALAIALAALLRSQGTRPQPTRIVALTAFPVLYSVVAIMDGMNIGYRHMLPIHPFLYMAIGSGLAGWAWTVQGQPRSWRPWAVAGLGLWLAVSLARVYPWEISYFNELAGGPGRGYRYLADSNVDWGQADRVRDRYLAEHPDTITLPPAAKLNPAPGTYLISAARLQGSGISRVDAYEWFRHRQPDETLAYSQLVYRVSDAPAWLVQCNQPVTPLPADVVQTQIGPPQQVRSLEVDCSQAWVYPDGGATDGLYALHYDLLTQQRLCLPALLPCPPMARDPFTARHLAGASLSFEQPTNGQLPAFALFQHAGTGGSRYAAAATAPAESDAAVALDGPLALLDAVAHSDGQELEVETWWQVVAGPIERPFSIMGHGLDAAGATVAVADGLGVSPLALQTGDVLVQRHRFPVDSALVQFRTGAYWLDPAVERWPLTDNPELDTITFSLEQLVQLDRPKR